MQWDDPLGRKGGLANPKCQPAARWQLEPPRDHTNSQSEEWHTSSLEVNVDAAAASGLSCLTPTRMAVVNEVAGKTREWSVNQESAQHKQPQLLYSHTINLGSAAKVGSTNNVVNPLSPQHSTLRLPAVFMINLVMQHLDR